MKDLRTRLLGLVANPTLNAAYWFLSIPEINSQTAETFNHHNT